MKTSAFAILTLLLQSGLAASAASSSLSFSITPNGTYTVSVDGQVWFASQDTYVTSGSEVHSLRAGTLILEKTTESSGRDGLGRFTETAMTLRAGTSHVQFAVKVYEDESTLEFVQRFPDGLNGTASGASTDATVRNGVSSSFPSWRPATITGTDRGWMAYDGWDCDGKNGDCLLQPVAPAGHGALTHALVVYCTCLH